jgi:cytochrome c oxidase assembly factor CtaG
MNNFSFDEIQRKDLFIALGLWLTVEFVSFVFFPAVQLIDPGARLRTWFLISIPLGIGGALLISASSRFVAMSHEKVTGTTKMLYVFLAQFGGWIGLVGILFPFFMVCSEFFSNLKL